MLSLKTKKGNTHKYSYDTSKHPNGWVTWNGNAEPPGPTPSNPDPKPTDPKPTNPTNPTPTNPKPSNPVPNPGDTGTSKPIGNLPGPWLNGDRLAEFWGYVKWFMKYNMPMFMIVIAVFVVGMVMDMITDIPIKAKKEQERDKGNDDDVDVKYY